MRETLDCTSCELSARPGVMCGVVASRTIREMVKIGYDISSDMRPEGEIVAQQLASDESVREIAESECGFRMLQQQSVRQGYGTVTY